MNIFVTDSNPFSAAKNLCNRHIVKMPSETSTMLKMAFSDLHPNHKKIAYFSHPASIWVRQSLHNFEWTVLHGLAQCEEYTIRYKRRHASQDFIEWAEQNYQYLEFPTVDLTPFARCFSSYKETLDKEEPNTLLAYRKFYSLDKKDFAKWPTANHIPDWWEDKSDNYIDKSFVNGIYSKR